MAQRETWATRLGFILAAVGSAVGLGNIWRFPFQASQNGGSAFLLVYLLFVLAVGLPAILVEFVVGRRSERNPINAFDRLGHGNWAFIGVLGVITGFVILSYYSVVGGWVLRYFLGSFTGAYFGDPGTYFETIATGFDAIGFHALFMLMTAGIVAVGIKRGIELSVKFMVPAIVLLLVGIAVYATTLDGAATGYEFYLSFDANVVAENFTDVLPAAAGQALFTLSLGMGVMITYASYLGENRNLAIDGFTIAALDTFIAVLAGIVVFPLLAAIGQLTGEGGPGVLFVALADAFANLPGGTVLGIIFFGVITIAALSSAISIFEVITSFFIDNFGLDRQVATAIVALITFLAGVPTALDLGTLDLYDRVTAELLLPLGLFLLVIFVGWVYDEANDELGRGMRDTWDLATAWEWHVRVPILLIIGYTLYLSVRSFAGI